MADQTKFFFDVWLTHAGTVYRSVPFGVVTDWIQQGRLLDDDRVRPVGTEQWFILGEVPAFASFIPKPDELRTDQQAEALEPVESSFSWGKKEEGEEADPDMIPLIDVSLVLLIFFMITSTVAVATSRIKTPAAKNIVDPDGTAKIIWVGIDFVDDLTPPKYTVRVELDDKDRKKNTFVDLTREKALEKINEICQNQVVPEVIVAAHQQLLFEQLRDLSVELEKQKSQQRIGRIRIEVAEIR
jgi:biopolymer transport protein ExbD